MEIPLDVQILYIYIFHIHTYLHICIHIFAYIHNIHMYIYIYNCIYIYIYTRCIYYEARCRSFFINSSCILYLCNGYINQNPLYRADTSFRPCSGKMPPFWRQHSTWVNATITNSNTVCAIMVCFSFHSENLCKVNGSQ